MSSQGIPVVIRNGTKTLTVLENNPEVMTTLAHKLGMYLATQLHFETTKRLTDLISNKGLSKALAFHDVYSFTDLDLLNLIPRPVYALLVILPLTPAWNADRLSEDKEKPDYQGYGPGEPVIWFKQTIGHACGSIGLLHCALNGEAANFIARQSFLEKLKEDILPLGMGKAHLA